MHKTKRVIANQSSDWCGNPLSCRIAATVFCNENHPFQGENRNLLPLPPSVASQGIATGLRPSQ